MTVKILKALWVKFDHGDPINNEELDMLIASAQEGLQYLEARGQVWQMPMSRTLLDLYRLQGFWRERQRTG